MFWAVRDLFQPSWGQVSVSVLSLHESPAAPTGLRLTAAAALLSSLAVLHLNSRAGRNSISLSAPDADNVIIDTYHIALRSAALWEAGGIAGLRVAPLSTCTMNVK